MVTDRPGSGKARHLAGSRRPAKKDPSELEGEGDAELAKPRPVDRFLPVSRSPAPIRAADR
jgi:hypothetical protein